MIHKTLLCAGALALASAILSAPAVAATRDITADVKRILITSNGSYGGCMAFLTANPASELPACSQSWVSFSCSGDFTDAVRAYRMLDQAQLALATGKRVQVWFTDDSLHNGYCLATRIDLIQ